MRGSFAILLPQTTVLLSFLFEVFKHKTFIGKLTKFSYIPRFDYTKKKYIQGNLVLRASYSKI